MTAFDDVVAWTAGLNLLGGIPMLGEASPNNVTVTRQAKLPSGWADVASGTGRSSGGFGVALVEGHLVVAGYRLVEDARPRTRFTSFPVAWGSSKAPAEKQHVEKDKNAAAMSLLEAWLREADLGLDEAQKRNLEEVKRSLNSERQPGQKLFP